MYSGARRALFVKSTRSDFAWTRWAERWGRWRRDRRRIEL